ncbi:MAG: FG-GAP repeat protein [Myxococcota bacterium]
MPFDPMVVRAATAALWVGISGCGAPTPAPLAPGIGVVPHRTWTADEPYDFAGSALDAADTTGDGLAEILVGTPSVWIEDEGPTDRSHGGMYLMPSQSGSGTLADRSLAAFGGRRNGDGLGFSVALPGDLSGDGVADLLIAGNLSEDPYAAVGLYTGPERNDVPVRMVTTRLLFDPFGASAPGVVIGCGDLNDDGADDLCAGGFSPLNGTSPNQSYVYFGPLPAGDVPVDGADVVLRGPNASWSPPTMAGGSDVTGDGRVDLWVGANYLDGGAGGAFLVSELSGPVVELLEQPTWRGATTEDRAGSTLARGEDLDGDGLGDLYLGAGVANGRRGQGSVLVDKDGGLVSDAYARFDGDDGDGLGSAAEIADLDGDGSADLAIGIPRYPFDRPGAVAVFRGPVVAGVHTVADADLVFHGGDRPDGFGGALVAAEVDGDGVMDLVVGAPRDPTGGEDAGGVHLFLGAALW